MELQVLIHKDVETGYLWASVAQLPGCFASGETKEELLEALAEAVEMYLEDAEPAALIESVRVENFRLGDDTGLVPA